MGFAVYAHCRFLEEEYGFKTIRLQVSRYGFVDMDQRDLVLSSDVAMVTCMLATNEIGAIQPIAEMTKRIRAFEGAAVASLTR